MKTDEEKLRELDEWLIENKICPEYRGRYRSRPTTNPVASMEVLKKCNQKVSVKLHQFNPQNKGEFSISAGATQSSPDILIHAETLELAICLFAKKLWEGK